MSGAPTIELKDTGRVIDGTKMSILQYPCQSNLPHVGTGHSILESKCQCMNGWQKFYTIKDLDGAIVHFYYETNHFKES